MNNLYGGAMIEALPVRYFRWLSAEEISQFDIRNIDKNAKTGYILEVTIEYPSHLHDLHNDLPLAPESLSIKMEDLSPYCHELYKSLHKGKTEGEISEKNSFLHFEQRKNTLFTIDTYNSTFSKDSF